MRDLINTISPLTDAEAIQLLRSIVRISRRDIGSITISELVTAFQQIHGLRLTGTVNEQVKRVLERPRFCQNVDRLVLEAKDKCRWDHTQWDGTKFIIPDPKPCILTYYVEKALPGLTNIETQGVFAASARAWEAVCFVQLVPAQDPGQCNFFFEIQHIDGASSTLAWQELPCGKDTTKTRLTGRYDTGEPWIVSIQPPPNSIDAQRVITHEWGHGLGLDHLPDGNLLAPYYDKSIQAPQAGDIKEAQLRYGPPLATGPAPEPEPPEDEQATVDFVEPDGTVWHGQAKKMA